MMRRLTLAIAIVTAALGAPQISRGETVLRFIPQADLRVLDPIWTSAYITRNLTGRGHPLDPVSMTSPAEPLSNCGPSTDFIADLARQELTVARSGEELSGLDRDLAAQNRHAWPGSHLVAFPRRVIRLVQVLLADHPPGARIEQHDIGVRAHCQRALARV